MVDPEIIREWLTKADEDFGFVRINLDELVKLGSHLFSSFSDSSENPDTSNCSSWAGL
jgi:hypothetical protein